MRARTFVAIVSVLTLLAAPGAATQVDQDRGSKAQLQLGTPATRDVLCVDPYYFGGTSESFSGTDRMRGNIYTFTAAQTLTEITVQLNFTGSANLYFYVLSAPALNDPYTTVSETLVPSASAGQAYYSSGPISVALNPGTFYAVGAAWAPETVTYIRDPATLPRAWALGNVESSAQLTGTPPYTVPVSINAFTGAEYSMTLCFGPLVPVELQSLSVE